MNFILGRSSIINSKKAFASLTTTALTNHFVIGVAASANRSLLFNKPTIEQQRASYYTFSLTDKPVKNQKTTRPKVTKNRSLPLTYEQTQFAHLIGVNKSWNSWNTCK